jgi:hypothetical protein
LGVLVRAPKRRYRRDIAGDTSPETRRASQLLLKAIRSLPEDEQDTVLAHLLEGALAPGEPRAPRMELSAPAWPERHAKLLLQRLAAGETITQIAPVIGLEPELLRLVLEDLAKRTHRSERLAPIFRQLAGGGTVAQAAEALGLTTEEVAAELSPAEPLSSIVSAALMTRAALPGPPVSQFSTTAQGPLRSMPVRFPEQQYQRLKDWCEANGFPMAVVVRGVVERFLDEQQRRAA